MTKIKATTLLDKLFAMKLDIETDEGKLKKKKAQYNIGRDALLDNFTKDEISSLKTNKAKVAVVKSVVPQVEDQDKFFKYVLRNKASDLLKNGVNTAAFRERLNDGKKVPGVTTFTRVSLRISKA